LHPDRPDYILIEFIDQKVDISKGREKKIEGLISRKTCGGCKFRLAMWLIAKSWTLTVGL